MVRLSLDEPLGELRTAQGDALVVVLAHGEVVGELPLPAPAGVVEVERLREALATELGERIWRRELEHAFTLATRGGEPAARPAPTVAVVERRGPGDVERGAAGSDAEVIAVIGHDCQPDPDWLDGLGEVFADPLVMAVAGYVGPAAPGARARPVPERTVYDGLRTTRLEVPDGNVVIRRSAIEGFGPFDDGLFARILRSGHRVAFDPGRIVWRSARDGEPMPPPPPAPDGEAARVTQADDPLLSVTVASYNRREKLAQVLRGLAAQTYPADRFEVVLVLDGSTDGSAEMARSLDLPYSVRVLEQENRGLSASRNRGSHEAQHPIVVWLDDDIVPDPPFLSAHAHAHSGGGRNRIVLGHYPPADESSDLLSTMVRGVWHDFFRRRSEPGHQWSYIDFADGNMSAPPSLVAEAGGWDEDFAQATVRRQDWEFAIRLLERGVEFADCPDASGRHYFDSTLAAAFRNRRVEGHSDVVLGRKHPGVRGHLFLARLARSVTAGGARGRLVELAYRRPAVAAALVRGGRGLLRPTEVAGRRAWWPLFGQLLSLAYMSGVRDGLPTLGEFRDFVAPILSGEFATRVPVRLDQRGTLQIPTAVTPVTLALEYGSAAIGQLDALEPEAQWDWDVLAARVARNHWQAFRAAVEGGDPA